MAIYEYSNGLGKRRQVFGSMLRPPPVAIRFVVGDDRELNADFSEALDCADKTEAECFADPTVFLRVPARGVKARVPDYAIDYKGVPASKSLPRRMGGKHDSLNGHPVKRHADGGYTNLQGQPIVQNRADYDRESRRTGFKRE